MKTSEQIWRDYHAGLLSFISHRVNNRDLAEDLLQDVFVKNTFEGVAHVACDALKQ